MDFEDVARLTSGTHSQYVGARHHWVPRFYLERFTDSNGIVTVHDLDSGTSAARAPIKVAAQRDFYTAIDDQMRPVGNIEALLGRVEAEAADAMRQLTHPMFRQIPVPPDHRIALASFLAMQTLRGPRWRRTVEIMTDMELRLALSWVNEGNVDAYLESIGLESNEDNRADVLEVVASLSETQFSSHPNEHLRLMLNLFERTWPLFFHRPVFLVTFPEPCLWTCDEPVVPIGDPAPQSANASMGFGMASQIWFPLDPEHMLMLGGLNSALPDGQITASMEDAIGVNQAVAGSAHRYVFSTEGVDASQVRDFARTGPVMRVTGPAVTDLPGWADVINRRHPLGRTRPADWREKQ